MLVDVENSSAMNDSTASGEASISSSGNQIPPKKAEKKKRNLPGMPGIIFSCSSQYMHFYVFVLIQTNLVYKLQNGYMICSWFVYVKMVCGGI